VESRRNYLKIIGAVGATCAFPFAADELYGQEHAHEHGAPAFKAPAVPPFEPKFFNVAEGLVVVRLADLIIPPTDTPGASAAGVPQYIDMVVSNNPEHRNLMREGLAWLDKHSQEAHGKKFVELGEEEQIAILEPLSDAGQADTRSEVEFFRAFKNMTADGYYTSYAGLVQELGYKGNQALSSFPGCTHEH
jgi:hypothetical protein